MKEKRRSPADKLGFISEKFRHLPFKPKRIQTTNQMA